MPPSVQRPGFIAEGKKAITNPQVYHWMEQVSVANINAGYTLLPAVPYYRYRVLRMTLIAIGGAVTGATDVRVLATQSAAAVALMVAAIAGLTQNTEVASGSAAGVILAGGASYGYNDVNTAITVGKTGGAAATATSVQVAIEYTLERA